MTLTVTHCNVRSNGQWTVEFDVVGASGEPDKAIAILFADPKTDVDKVLAAAAAQVRDDSPVWDGVPQVTSHEAAVGRKFDVTLAAVKEVVKEKRL